MNIVKFNSNLHQRTSNIHQFAGMDAQNNYLATGQAMCWDTDIFDHFSIDKLQECSPNGWQIYVGYQFDKHTTNTI